MPNETGEILADLRSAGLSCDIDEGSGRVEIELLKPAGFTAEDRLFPPYRPVLEVCSPPYRDDVLAWMQIQYEDFDSLADEYRVLADMCAEAIKGLTQRDDNG